MDLFADMFAKPTSKTDKGAKSGLENIVFTQNWKLPTAGGTKIWYSGKKEATDFADYVLFYALRCGCTYSLSISSVVFAMKSLETIAAICKGLEVPRLKLILSRQSKNCEQYRSKFGEVLNIFRDAGARGEIVFSAHHAKFALALNEDGSGWVLVTSANLNKNPKLENYLFTQDAETVAAFKQFAETACGSPVLKRITI